MLGWVSIQCMDAKAELWALAQCFVPSKLVRNSEGVSDEITDARQMNTWQVSRAYCSVWLCLQARQQSLLWISKRLFCWGLQSYHQCTIKIQYNTNLTQQITSTKQRTVQCIVCSSHPNTSALSPGNNHFYLDFYSCQINLVIGTVTLR